MTKAHITSPATGSVEAARRLVYKYGKALAIRYCEKRLVGSMTEFEDAYWGNVKKEVSNG